MFSLLSISLVLLSAVATCIATNVTAQESYSYLQQILSPSSELFLSTDPNVRNDTTQRWSVYEQASYSLIVKPATETDVQSIIKYASDEGIPFITTGGGYGYATGFTEIKNGLNIDLSLHRDVKVDAVSNTMTIGGAVTFDQIFQPLYDAEKEIQTGSSSSVGMIGAAIGGGVGPYTGLHGLIIDALLSVRIVTGTGEAVTASSTENADLFWAIRGAGHNFGVITSATFQIYNHTNGGYATNIDMDFAASANGTIFELLKSFQASQPAEMSILCSVHYNAMAGGTYMTVSVIYIGPKEKGTALVQPFLAAKPLRQNITEAPWSNLFYSVANEGGDKYARIRGGNQSIYGWNTYTFDVQTYIDVFNEVDAFFDENPSIQQGSQWEMEQFAHQTTRSIPDASTAYPYRNTTMYNFFQYTLPNASFGETFSDFANRNRDKMVGTSGSASGGLETYVNYGHGDEKPEAWYSARKMPQLQAVKAKWDPKSLFSYYKGIPQPAA